jgi:MFS family permease
MSSNRSKLALIVVSQFLCTSLWFSGNTIAHHLSTEQQTEFVAHFTSTVQLGFICGTLLFALMALVDRFSPSKIFFLSAVVAAGFNWGLTLPSASSNTLLLFRFCTGFFLAGIYPVGMKIAADYFQQGLGKSLGFLVGALVLGTALPHLVTTTLADVNWKVVVITTSSLALLGGFLIFWVVPDGPYRKTSARFSLENLHYGFQQKNLRQAAFGYFGHMWELYTFWALVPMLLNEYNTQQQKQLNVPLWSFVVIGIGSLACAASGLLGQRFGDKKVATWALSISCACCLLSPILLQSTSSFFVLSFLCVWGVAVIADSPLFSALVSQAALAEWRGSTLTIVTCIGFGITIISLQLFRWLAQILPFPWYFVFLAIGPLFGLAALISPSLKRPIPSSV